MLALRITNIKQIMHLMLDKNETAFDSFLLSSAEFSTFATLTIDGHLHPDFYTEEELENLQSEAALQNRVFSRQMIRWSQAKSQCFDFIKGSKVPLRFLIVLYLAEENVARFLAGTDTTLTACDISGLSLNIKYDGTNLIATCAASLNIFTPDRTVDQAWDSMIQKFFDKHGIPYEIL